MDNTPDNLIAKYFIFDKFMLYSKELLLLFCITIYTIDLFSLLFISSNIIESASESLKE